MENLKYWQSVATPPPGVLKKITGGRLSGMTDIKPQWRYQVMTETYGPCGIGWKFTVIKKWSEPASNNQIMAFADIELFINVDGKWSDAIPGHGGSMLIAKESRGLHSSDEAYKMAITDALSTAMKMIGVAADIYLGNWDGSKYNKPHKSNTQNNQQPAKLDPALKKAFGFIQIMDEDSKRYGARLFDVVTYGVIYTKKCWDKTPEDIRVKLGKGFKRHIFGTAEQHDTINKNNQPEPEAKNLGDKLQPKPGGEPIWMKPFNDLSSISPEAFETAKKELGAPSQVNYQDFKKRVNEIVDRENAA